MLRWRTPYLALALVAAACADNLAEAVSGAGSDGGSPEAGAITPPPGPTATATATGNPPPGPPDSGDQVEAGSDAGGKDAGSLEAGACDTCPTGMCDLTGQCALHAFVTSGTTDAKLNIGGNSGVGALDSFCSAAAASAQLPHTSYLAWAYADTGSGSDKFPWQRFGQTSRAWYTSRGALVGDLSTLANSTVFNAIAADEHGQLVPAGSVAWTGLTMSGTPTSDCNQWSSNDSGFIGAVGQADSRASWLFVATRKCSLLAHVYCFQAP